MSRTFRFVAVWATLVAMAIPVGLASVKAADGPSSGEPKRPGECPIVNGFLDPPASARPAGYWAWLNGYVDVDRFKWELVEWKDKGLSKAFIFECGARDPQKIVPAGPAFMSPESVRAIAHAIKEAGRVGMELGFTTSSSWNAGGSWVKPEHASMGLFKSEVAVEGPASFSEILPFPSVPSKAPKGADGLPAYHKDIAVLAVPEPRIVPGYEFIIRDVGSIVDLAARMDSDGRLTWDVPHGKWTVMRFVCMNTGQGLAIPSPNSHGLAIDHFSAEATRRHFEYLIDKLQSAVGPLRDTALTTMYLCSYELRGAVWTPDFVDQFKQRRGYDMTPYLPVLFGAKVASKEVTERFDYDYRKTQGDLLVDAFYKTAAKVSHEHGLLLCAEAGGPGPPTHNVPVDALKAQGVIDIPRGEFWTDLHLWVVKETACASHIYGKTVVDMEAFTGWTHWQHGPFELKPFADRAMCEGTNHFTFHTSPHNPRDAGLPGWVYHAGTHFAPSIAWWPKATAFVDYLARSCYLLQQGLFVGDICYYYGDQAYNFVPPKNVDPSLGPGYDYDVTNAEVILTRMNVQDGRIVLPDGLSYELLVLPEREDMDLDVLRKLEQLTRDGATVVGRKPTRSNGLADYRRRDADVRALADKIWGPCDGTAVHEHTYGKGRVIWGRTLRNILQSRGIGPDFTFKGQDDETDLDYLHRRDGEADIYFVSNRNSRWEEADCLFRVTGKAPELWMPDTGRILRPAVYREVSGGTELPLRLAPSGSVFIVFRDKVPEDHLVSIDGKNRRGRPDWPPAIEIDYAEGGGENLQATVFEGGQYSLKSARDKTIHTEVPAPRAAQEIEGPWRVRFPEGWGAPQQATFDKLISWTEHPDKGIKYFSGVATYETEFDLPAEALNRECRLVLDLGQVSKVADVSLNGKGLGVLWKPPFRIDVTRATRPGRNRLVIDVANTWSNRLVGDALSPESQRFCRTNVTESRSWRVKWKDTPLAESGLLGPVRLISAAAVKIKL